MIAGTLCRCGHLLDCCADCRGWMVANSPRIARDWERRWLRWGSLWSFLVVGADLLEANRLGVYLARRFLA